MNNAELFERARQVIPGGVNSPVRAFSRRRRHAALHRPRRGRLHGRRRRPALHRLHRFVGADDPRPPPPGRRSRGASRGRRGPVVRRADRARGRAGRGDPASRAEHGAGAPRELRHRSGDERTSPGARRDRAQRHRQVRRLLPRPRRRVAGEGGLGPRHLRPPDQRRRAGGRGPAHARARVQQRRRARGSVRLARPHDRLRDDRADRRQHEFRACQRALHAAAARAVQRERLAAGVRRGDDRLSRRTRRRAGALRTIAARLRARPQRLRQGDRRRHAAGGLRRQARGHGKAGAARAGLPRPARCPATRLPPRAAWRRCTRSRSPASSTPSPSAHARSSRD